ncbi:hypothetical protein PanWU01x14_238210 [Parasponia andersonii]|uniref:Uncharacterized protein n=1 Tax=Parasponia andersonii TaxID=3476 RepID=A0A2P5BHL6_PARAD|nr:hypothetical protein PanWU01x14_238210 [Parasponia andersonii]
MPYRVSTVKATIQSSYKNFTFQIANKSNAPNISNSCCHVVSAFTAPRIEPLASCVEPFESVALQAVADIGLI